MIKAFENIGWVCFLFSGEKYGEEGVKSLAWVGDALGCFILCVLREMRGRCSYPFPT